MPTPTIGQTVTFKFAGDPNAVTITGLAVVVAAGRVIVAAANDTTGPAAGHQSPYPFDVPVANILTAV